MANAVASKHEDPQDLTKQVLHEMLTENTGRSLCDSGDYFGRHWERNQCRSFENESESRIHADTGKYGSIWVVHSLYHWLASRLEFNPELDKKFRDFADEPEREKDTWFSCVDQFKDKLVEEGEESGNEVGGIYGEGEPMTINTYNSNGDCLSQVIQFLYWEDQDGAHILLQIHGGADVRGGYTSPRAFDVCGDSELAMLDFDQATVYCTDTKPGVDKNQTFFPGEGPEDCHVTWDLRGGYWEEIDDYDTGNKTPEMDSLVFVAHDADPEDTPDGEPPAPGKGYVYVDEDETPHCPVCGSPLAAHFM